MLDFEGPMAHTSMAHLRLWTSNAERGARNGLSLGTGDSDALQ